MRLSARRALNDMWTRVRTSLQLVSATARTARRHKELLLFPVLSFFSTAALFLGLVVLTGIVTLLIVQADDVSSIGLVVAVVAVCLPSSTAARVGNVLQCALTFAAFRALREERTSPGTALAHALGRTGAIMAYAPLRSRPACSSRPGLDPRSRTFFSRLLPSLGVASSVVPLMAIRCWSESHAEDSRRSGGPSRCSGSDGVRPRSPWWA
jgi:hypothetical protein